MLQEFFERRFSRTKHASGAWRTTRISRHGRFVRWCAGLLSFKHGELDKIASLCRPFSLVLDFGCGNGAHAHFFTDGCAATVVAVDWSPEALLSINRPARGTILPVCADLHALPFKPSSFDALYTIDTLGHLRAPERALDEIVRVCRSAAPLFLHSECSDYRTRLPDRKLIQRAGYDPVAALDGHASIRPAREMRVLYEQRFSLRTFYSPAGIAGWLIGYPEKYAAALFRARMYLFAVGCGIAALLKKLPPFKVVFRIVNMLSNRLELQLGLEGGGSCFARCRCTIMPLVPGSAAIDLIIPSFRRTGSLGRAVGSVIGQCTAADRIYIVHQGSEPPPAFDDPRIRVLLQRIPNLPAARNTGLTAGGNPIVLFIDDDCTALPGLLDGHRRAYSDDTVGAIAGHIDDPLFPPDATMPSFFNITNGELKQHFGLPLSGESISVMGANMSFRRDALEAIGGFDVQYAGNALWEEIDAAFRLQNTGYSVRFAADAGVQHHRETNGGCRTGNNVWRLYCTFANTTYFAVTYAPRNHATAWLRYWWFRLEFLSRRDKPGWPRHAPLLVAAGGAGVAAGIIRHFLHGHRRALPEAVLRLHERVLRSAA